MNKYAHIISDILARPALLIAGAGVISALSLIAALTAEVVFGLEPCIMCLYQRIPFALIVLEALLYFAFRGKLMSMHLWNWGVLADLTLLFFINSGLAFYHTGIEQKWWTSAVEGCAVSFDSLSEPQSLLENILSAPTARCDEIPWADPLFGLSMANYNVLLCLGLGVICLIGMIKALKTSPARP